jgi:glycosyltransferase involved in cell wall biosynthesis
MVPKNVSHESSVNKVLVIGMLDSVHFARWLKQFENQNIEFFVFASKKYRSLHPILIDLLKSSPNARYKLVRRPYLFRLSGFKDYFEFELPRNFRFLHGRARALKKVISKSDFRYVHALEIQGAGYLLTSIPRRMLESTKVIMTNWGSDIYFFKNDPEHASLIKTALEISDYYSAECSRDYLLARNIGFRGIELPCIPNAGGFNFESLDEVKCPPSQRNQLMIKGYGGKFGKAEIPIGLISRIAEVFPQINFYIYSVTDDIQKLIDALDPMLKSRIRTTNVNEHVAHKDFLKEFSNSRAYIGFSCSDGISTSFLEALVHGTYPIQSNTSCADEWIDRGCVASVINLDRAELFRAIHSALSNDRLVDTAAEVNMGIAFSVLEYEKVREQALKFYL